MEMKTKAVVDRSSSLAYWSNANREPGSIYTYRVTLYRHRDGKLFLRPTGGAAMSIGEIRWINETQARRFLRDHAMDGVTGHGYTDEEIEDVLAGKSVSGSRSLEGRSLPCPDLHGF